MSGSAPRFLSAVSSIKPAKPADRASPDEVEIDALIGEQHADEQHLAQLELAEAFERARGVRFAAEADLDDVDAGLRHGDDSSRRRIHIIASDRRWWR